LKKVQGGRVQGFSGSGFRVQRFRVQGFNGSPPEGGRRFRVHHLKVAGGSRFNRLRLVR